MIFKNRLCISLCLSVFVAIFATSISAQTRARVVTNPESRPVNTQAPTPTVKRTVLSSPTTQRPVLTNQITVAPNKLSQPLVKNTADVKPTNSILNTANSRLIYAPTLNQRLISSIQTKIGVPYLLGSVGPNRYDCS